jgi:hypothetical protein
MIVVNYDKGFAKISQRYAFRDRSVAPSLKPAPTGRAPTHAARGYRTRKLWKCKACNCQFNITSGTIFASRKLAIRDYLLAIAIFVNGAKGHSALQLRYRGDGRGTGSVNYVRDLC